MSGTSVIGNRARGALVQCRRAVIDSCIFENNTGPAISITTDAYYWWESSGTSDVTVSNCNISGANKGAAHSYAALSIFAEVGSLQSGPPLPGSAGVHTDVTLTKNNISDTDASAVYIGSTTGCMVYKNTFSAVCLAPNSGYPNGNSALHIESSDAIHVTQNVLVGPTPIGWAMNNSTNVVVSGNFGF